MSEQNLRLVYSSSLVNVPIIYQLIRRYDLTVNILRAQVSEEAGWIDIQVSAEPARLEEAVSWLRAQGVEVHILKG